MKALTLSLLASVLIAGSLAADPVTDLLNSQVITSRRESMISTPQTYKIVRGRVAYGGMLIDVATSKNALDLITPAKNGSGEYNLDRDIITGKAVGFKFLTIRF